MKQVIRYKCSFCSRLAARPETILRHEAECLHNPDGRNCYQCAYSVQGGFVDTPYGEILDEKIPYCNIHLEPLPHLRADGFTAVKCEYFARDNKIYDERNDEDVRKAVDALFDSI